MAPKRRAAPPVVDPVALEQQRLDEMERRHRQSVLLRTRLEDIMEEESTRAAVVLKDIEARWIKILRERKQQELLKDIEIARNTFEKTLDRKNAVIAMMGMDLEEAETQYRLALRTHLSNIDALVELQRRRMADLESQFERDLLQMRGDFSMERTQLLRNHELELADLFLIIKTMNDEAEAKDRSLQEEISESHETATERMEEDKKQMQSDLKKQNEKIRQDLDARYKEFMASAQANLKDYADKTKEDEDTAEKIADQMRKISRLQESIDTWKSNLNNNTHECEQRNRDMKAEKDATARHYKALKHRMTRWRKMQSMRVRALVTNASDAQQRLQRRADAAERLLHWVALCRPLETERARVLGADEAAGVADVVADVTQRAAEHARHVVGTSNAAKPALFGVVGAPPSHEPSNAMERFWARYNHVLLDNTAIDQEKFHLEQENKKLRLLLKQYIDGVSVHDDVMAQRNPLLIATSVGAAAPRDTAVAGASRRARGPATTDGNKVITEVMRQRAA